MKKTETVDPKFKTGQERIRYIWEQTGQTQKEFAESLGIGQPHLSGLMSNRRPSNRTLTLISEKTGASLEWLQTGEGDVYIKGSSHEDPPELANVIDKARELWDNFEDVERYEMAANMLRVLTQRKKAGNAAEKKDEGKK